MAPQPRKGQIGGSRAHSALAFIVCRRSRRKRSNDLIDTQGVLELPSLLHATLTDLSTAVSDRQVSSTALTTAYLTRIAEVNNYFRAVIETNPDALSIAGALDEEQRTRGRRSPLHGIPVLLKDTIFTGDKMEATAGSTVLLGARPAHEARLVTRLRDGGALILSKANKSEWGTFRATAGASAWSARGGLSMGAYCKDMRPSGSSSGSTVAIALGLTAACIGGETDGSIIWPASRAGIVGIKPTLGLVSTDGDSRSRRNDDTYASACSGGTDLTGLRIGLPSSSLLQNNDAPLLHAFEDPLGLLHSHGGATIIRDANFACQGEYNQQDKLSKGAQRALRAGCFQNDIKHHLDNLAVNPHSIKDIDDIIRLTETDRREEYPRRGIDLFELASSVDTAGPEFHAALKQNARFAGEGSIPGTLRTHRLDLIAAPAMFGATGSLACRSGLPVVTVPLGKHPKGSTPTTRWNSGGPDKVVDIAPGVPFGIIFTGGARTERTLLRVAYAFEQMTRVREMLVVYNPPKIDLSDVLA
ncbi:amidase signature domain-containing protein [Apodospora peruviana]|uniref:Amidase signature domain-containing protein n=1 Tax=Apodospora peruviana TaxID=516989 RepID=A0AAE0IPG5_9PEZI|nr:amidase signature domain-containing protein [Apodospora peruviana]